MAQLNLVAGFISENYTSGICSKVCNIGFDVLGHCRKHNVTFIYKYSLRGHLSFQFLCCKYYAILKVKRSELLSSYMEAVSHWSHYCTRCSQHTISESYKISSIRDVTEIPATSCV